jgi:glutamate-1-semialdehyde 2,1-aminomutase
VKAEPRSSDLARQEILERYRALTSASASAHARARASLAGGTTGNLRYFQPYPMFFATGEGSSMVDLDGRRLLDCFLCNGPLLLGHRHPAIVSAVRKHEATGPLVVNPMLAVEAAESVQRVVPCAERVRFQNTGTEAVMTAVRLARAATGRARIVKFLGHYHGQDDQFLVGLDPTGAPFGSGIPSRAYADVVQVRYGDIGALERALDEDPEIGTVLLDAAMHSGGLWGSSTEYLRQVRDLTRQRKIVLIFDEVITGFRLAPGGAQAFHQVTPDLATFGKALGAGEKVSAVAGTEALMRHLDPERPVGHPGVFQSGTSNDGTAGLAAAAAATALYGELGEGGQYSVLEGRARRLADGLRAAFTSAGVPHHVNQLSSMLQLFFSERAPSFEAFAQVPPGPVALFYLAMINEGVLLSLPTSNHIYLSFAHTDADIERALAAARQVLERYDFGAIVRERSTP